MEGEKRQYTKEFKKEVVEYSLSSGKTVEEVSRDLASPSNSLAQAIPERQRISLSRSW